MADADAFGYPCLSLDETITVLSKLREENPELAGEPLWLMNVPPLRYPLLSVGRVLHNGNFRIGLYVETGS